MRIIFAIAAALLSIFVGSAQNTPTQTIRGKVIEESTGEPLPFASVRVLEKPDLGVIADSVGCFGIASVPIGRYTLQCSLPGYSPVLLKEQMVSSGKELVVEFVLPEAVSVLDEIVVKINKQEPLNRAAKVGARMFSVDEFTRMPGAAEDPARLASSFAGVSAGGANNGISIHGNAPHLLAWRIEGVEIPNPNHYADISVLGGGIVSSLSTKVIGNSDFFTAAFPAEYNNAISGIFDMRMRNGNNRCHEHAVQAGILGLDVASEGPLGNGGSYLANYRYSFLGLVSQLGLADLDGQVLDYQDINFKLNLPTANAGTFSLWGTGLIDNFKRPAENIGNKEYTDDSNENKARQRMLATGFTHRLHFRSGANLRSTLAYTINTESTSCDYHFYALPSDNEPSANRFFTTAKTNSDIILNSSLQYPAGRHFSITTGFTITSMNSDMDIRQSPSFTEPMRRIVDTRNSTLYTSLFTNSHLHYGAFDLNLGLAFQYLAFNRSSSLEPRASMAWALTPRFRISAGYGIYSRKENTDVYFVEKDGRRVNEDLGFTHARHYMLGFSYRIDSNTDIKVEPYYQWLYDIPVEEGTGFSMLNNLDFIIDRDLNPNGKGRNYGVDITVERHLHHGWFGMLTGALFSSKYKASDGNWYHSRYDRTYIFNIIAGKEWMVGKNKSNVLVISGKYTFQGPERTSPIDYAATEAHPDHEVQYVEDRLFTVKLGIEPAYAFSVSYKINKKKVAHSLVLDFMHTVSFFGYKYNLKTGEYDEEKLGLSLPQIAYRLEF